MLAGLLLALQDADDRPGVLTATLPFGGLTLIEFQARLLIAAGASQIVVVVARQTPELLGALSRIGRRGVAVDTVRTASEIAERIHPMARLLLVADGLTTTAPIVAAMAEGAGDALLVVPEDDEAHGFERLGGGLGWAGLARLGPPRLAELAAMPRDYDIESTLIRLASQAGAAHFSLPEPALRQGHAIDHSAALMGRRSRTALAAVVSTRRTWFDRVVVNPIARRAIVPLVARAIPAAAIGVAVSLVAALGLVALWFDHPIVGLAATIVGAIGGAIVEVLAGLRDDPAGARLAMRAGKALPAAALLVAGYRDSLGSGDSGPVTVAIVLVATAALVERARRGDAPGWWGTPPTYVVLALAGAIVGFPAVGLVVAAVHAAVTLTAAIERLREQA